MSNYIVKVGGWAAHDQLASSDMNVIQQLVANSVDKTVQGDNVSGKLAFVAEGRFVPRVVTAPDANATFGVTDSTGPTVTGTSIVVVPSTLTADRTYQLSAVNAVENDNLEISVNPACTYVATIKDQAAATLLTLSARGNPAGQASWSRFIFKSGAWSVLESNTQAIRIANLGGIGSIGLSSMSGTSFADVPGYSASLSCVAGDVMLVNMNLGFQLSAAGTASLRTVVIDGGTPTTAIETPYQQPAGVLNTMFHSFGIAYNVANTGTVTWKVTRSVASGATCNVGGSSYPATISMLVLRQ